MMLQEVILTALNMQMNHEITNFYTYKNFASIADFQGLSGSCSWLNKQADEEKTHFEKFFTYVSDQNHIPHLLPIPEQSPEIITLDNIFEKVVTLEDQTTQNLRLVSSLAKEVGDDQTFELLQWFLREQVEETKMVDTIHKRILLSMNNLLIIDQELGKR